jgi:hypothetical protein
VVEAVALAQILVLDRPASGSHAKAPGRGGLVAGLVRGMLPNVHDRFATLLMLMLLLFAPVQIAHSLRGCMPCDARASAFAFATCRSCCIHAYLVWLAPFVQGPSSKAPPPCSPFRLDYVQ